MNKPTTTIEKKYRLETFCTDCYGEDPMGCFDGGKEIDYYDSLEEARKSKDKTERMNSLMECTIFDNETEEEII